MSAKAVIIGAPRSGSGKTSVAIGLMRALKRRGLKVRAAKSGPDYIDPGFHAAATGEPGVNLDSWAMPPALIAQLLAQQADGADILIIESAMGLFDGIPGEKGRSGSAAEIARRFGVPVVLALDVSGQSQTAAAVAKGFAVYDPAVEIAGVVMNKVGSDRHRRLSGEAIEAVGLPVIGSIQRDPSITLPERHLGLVQAEEHQGVDSHIERLADVAERSIDLDRLIDLARPVEIETDTDAAVTTSPGQRIALARDAAFSFLYPHHLAAWLAAGAEIVPFSPLNNEAPDPTCDVCWLPGGYPELHGGQLAAADKFRSGMVKFAAAKPVHGECGGYMALGQALEDADGVTHRMLGLLSHSTSFAQRKMNLGYRRATLLADSPIGPAGANLRGHEFHYARVTDPGNDLPLAELADGQGNALPASGARRGLVTGAFFHFIAREP